MKIAIVADWLVTFGGAEHVIAAFHSIWPDAPIFTTVRHKKKMGSLRDIRSIPSTLQNIFSLVSHHQPLLPFMPRAIEEHDVKGFDIILSSSHAIAKGIIPSPHSIHICYCHTPMRYAWEMENEYLKDFSIPNILKPSVKRELKRLRRWDLTTAKRVDHFIANSHTTQERIRRTYARESTVIHPPIDDRFFDLPLYPPLKKKDFYLAIGRLVPYKRFDFLIEAANQLQLPLKIAGSGQDLSKLKAMSGPTVEFLGHVRDDDLPDLYKSAKALLFPPFEDAGIVPLEAQACGTPVIAFRGGGALDSIEEGVTGVFFDTHSIPSLREALTVLHRTSWDPLRIRSHAQIFSRTRFCTRIKEEIEGVHTSMRYDVPHGTRRTLPQRRKWKSCSSWRVTSPARGTAHERSRS